MSDKIKFIPTSNIDLDSGNDVMPTNRPICDIVKDLNAAIKNNLQSAEEDWGFWWHAECNKDLPSNAPWPEYHWIACYAVTGGSEGHYVHLDLISRSEPKHRHMLLTKIWGGWDVACQIANETARLLGA